MGFLYSIAMRRILLITTLLIGVTFSGIAQTGSDSTSTDPFKNDPFFSRPISDFFNKNSDHRSPRQESTEEMVTNLNDEGLDFRGVIEAGPYNSSQLYSVYPNLPMIRYNRVDALFLGVKQERMQWYRDDWLGIPQFHPHGLIGYSFGQKEWDYTLGFEKMIGRQNHVILGGEYHNATTTNDEWRVGLNETSITAFTGGYDYLDYYKQQGWGGYLLARSDRYFEGGVAFSEDDFHSLDRESDWALFGAGDRYRVNPPVDIVNGFPLEQIELATLTFSASFNPKRLVLSNGFTFSMNGTAEFADTGIGTSDYKYSKYTGEMISYFNLGAGTILKYRLRMSNITGEAPRFKQLYLGGVGSLRALPYKSLGAGNAMILSNAELQFGNPINASGDWIDFDDFYFSLFLDSGWVDYNSDLVEASGPFKGFKNFSFPDLQHNGGIGLGSSLFRAELAWDLNDTDRAPVFWIRFNPTF